MAPEVYSTTSVYIYRKMECFRNKVLIKYK